MINRKKVLSSQNVLLWYFWEKIYLIWRYADLNRLLVGSSLIPLNIKLKQDNRTVCCNHKIVAAKASKTDTILDKFDCDQRKNVPEKGLTQHVRM